MNLLLVVLLMGAAVVLLVAVCLITLGDIIETEVSDPLQRLTHTIDPNMLDG